MQQLHFVYCEICGRPIEGEPVAIELDGAALYVCRGCAAKYGGKALPKTPQQQKKPAKPITQRQSSRLPELELVDNFGDIIRRARENLGLSREALAAMLGIKETVLRRIETGQLQPDLALARKIERALGVKILVESREETALSSSAKLEKGLTLGEIVEIRDEGEE